LAEQNNPLVQNESCFDRIKNQNEDDVDCGGICYACEIIEPIVVPCKTSLSNNVITIDDWWDMSLSTSNYSCTKEPEYYDPENFKLYIFKDNIEIHIQIYESTLPKIGTIYQLKHHSDAELGNASILFYDEFFDHHANSGELYLSYENGQWLVEICSVRLNGAYLYYDLSGRVLCDW